MTTPKSARKKPKAAAKAKAAPRAKASPRVKASSIDGYLAALPDDQRAALERIRKTVHAAVPGAEECISYQLPAFRVDGRVVLWFGAGTNHCALYPGALIEAFQDELTRWETSRGTIRFQPSAPLPAALIRKLVKARIALNAAKPARARR